MENNIKKNHENPFENLPTVSDEEMTELLEIFGDELEPDPYDPKDYINIKDVRY